MSYNTCTYNVHNTVCRRTLATASYFFVYCCDDLEVSTPAGLPGKVPYKFLSAEDSTYYHQFFNVDLHCLTLVKYSSPHVMLANSLR